MGLTAFHKFEDTKAAMEAACFYSDDFGVKGTVGKDVFFF